jgi:signal transduction histidine kinase/CheY-like chemotaxis protein
MPTIARRTLLWKYAAYFSALVSALLVVSSGLAGYFAYRESVTALEELQQANANFAALEIDRFIGRVEDALQSTVAKFNTRGAINADDLQIELIALLRHQPAITELRWVSASGREKLALSRVATDSLNSGRDGSNDVGFQGTRTAAQYLGPVYFRGETEPYLSIAASRNPGGDALIGEVNLKFVREVISNVHVGQAGYAYVVDHTGRLVSHPDLGLVLGKTDLSALPHVRHALAAKDARKLDGATQNLQGIAVIATAAPIRRLGWTVFAEQSRAEALRPVIASLARSIVLMLIGVTVAVVASVVFARNLVRPIRQLEAGAREIGEGKLDGRIYVTTGDEIEALGAQFNRMAERLQAIYASQEETIALRTRDLALANEAKSRFVAAASHDLRQPMHALALFVGQLRAHTGSAESFALLAKVERSVEAMQELLEALLDLSKLDMGAVFANARSLALQELLLRVVAQFAPAAEAKGLALTLVPTSLWVRSDPVLLERILSNLVANAVRYTDAGRVLLGCRRCNDHVDIMVADTGVGIAAAHLPHVFEEFYQAAPRRASTKGLGLGLAIVKRLATLLGHHVLIDSVPGRGTTVRVRVRRAAPEAGEPMLVRAPARELCGTCVLVVDDEDAPREAIAGLLEQWGCIVSVARGRNDALERARARAPDLVLCDLTLADGESGIDVVDRLRADLGRGLACAFVTGASAPAPVAELRARGDPIAFKPVRPAKLRALIEYLLASEGGTDHNRSLPVRSAAPRGDTRPE